MTVKEFINYIHKDERITKDTPIHYTTDMGFEKELEPTAIDIYDAEDSSPIILIW